MIRWLTVLLGALALGAAALFARGGGGCLAAGTLIATPRGAVPIESLRVGDTVWSVVDGQRIAARVEDVFAVAPLEFVELTTADGAVLRATPEHPVQVAAGTFVRADRLVVGRVILNAPLSGIATERRVKDNAPYLAAVRRVPADRAAYNLLVAPGGVFFANGLLVHNKGCFLPDTPILLADGTRVPIRDVHAGTVVLAFDAMGRTLPARVISVITHDVSSYLVVRTTGVELHVTEEHPFYVGDGVFKTAKALRVGELICAHDGAGGLAPQPLLALERVSAPATVYNLRTDEPHTFFADGIAVHNKGGGCFAAGTLIATPRGSRAIETLALGETVLAPAADGSLVPATIKGVFLNFSPLLTLHTDRGVLRTTAEHPLLGANGGFMAAESFAAGARLMRRDGEARVLAVERGPTDVAVYTLSVGAPHTFLADGFVAHNKGGGGSSSRSSGGSRGSGGDAPPAFVFFIIVIIIVVLVLKAKGTSSGDEELDYCFTRSQIEGKAAKTRELLAFISKVDLRWAPAELQTVARNVFTKLQACWAARDYTEMEPLMMRDLYEQHGAQLRGLRQTHEINVLEGLAVEAVDIVHLRYTDKQADRSFTALITASARDTYLDDRTSKFIRGDDAPARFQEFWTFQLIDGAFRLREIEQTKESDALTEENFFEQFTEQGRDQIYGKTAGTTGPAGPALPEAVQAKENKIERLLNFLVQTDKIWTRDEMLATARRTYLNVLLGWQDGRPNAFAGVQVTPELAAHLQSVNENNQRNGWRVEYRNLCVRKVEIVHVNNVHDRAQDAFTARISAHAQTVIAQGGAETRHDEYVKAWVEFWTFTRDGQRWVLNEILPDASGESALARENVDEGTGQQMLEWYYSKTRAN